MGILIFKVSKHPKKSVLHDKSFPKDTLVPFGNDLSCRTDFFGCFDTLNIKIRLFQLLGRTLLGAFGPSSVGEGSKQDILCLVSKAPKAHVQRHTKCLATKGTRTKPNLLGFQK